MPRVMSTRGQAMLDQIPPFFQTDPTLQAIYNAEADELDRLDVKVQVVQDNLFPAIANDHLDIWEDMLGLAVRPTGQTVEQRRVTVKAYLERITSSGSGTDWEKNATTLLGSTWSYRTHDPYDATSPTYGTVRVFLDYVAGSIRAEVAKTLLRSITPAAMVIDVQYSQGFILGESQVGVGIL